jgi:hypothetical protein
MKKIAFWNNYTCFAKNQAFNPNAYGIGEDIGYPVILLKEELSKLGYILETLDMDSVDNYKAVIFSDYPNPDTCCVDINTIPKEKRFLILSECEMIYKPNSRRDLLQMFSKVFSYNDELVRTCKYIKLNIPNKIKKLEAIGFDDKKFSTLIAGNKSSIEKGELYSERLNAINFMEKKHLADFDLYGINWDKTIYRGCKLIRGLNHIPFMQKIGKKHKSYKGKINKKLDTLSHYKFCFCYENSCQIEGYISEKIMDCFFASCVPIYYGAPNISTYIPEDCYIDFRKFSDYEELYNFLKSMPEEEYNKYLNSISNFLNSDKVYPFSAQAFVQTLIKEVVE